MLFLNILNEPSFHIIQICSGITHGRVLNEERYMRRLLIEVNLSAFVHTVS